MKNWFLPWIIGCILLFPLQQARADGPKKITAPEVKKMLEDRSAMLVHVLSQIEFEMQHIPGSINIPITQMEGTAKLPVQKDMALIFYCMGER